MNKILFVLLALSLTSFTAFAKEKGGAIDQNTSGTVEPDKGDGCGLGWQVTQKRSFLATTTRQTTNSFVPPTFGMTSGTIGCEQHSFAKNEQPAASFALANYEPLSLEMAEGRGEYLTGFAKIMGCSDAAVFNRMTQEKYNVIFNSENTSAVDMYKNVKEQISKDPVLAASCSV